MPNLPAKNIPTPKDDELAAAMHSALPHPWCTTCSHTHVPNMPAHTWACGQCGFGSWSTNVAAVHARLQPEHQVHPRFHAMQLGGAR